MSKLARQLGILTLAAAALAAVSCSGGKERSESGAAADTAQATADTSQTARNDSIYGIDTSPPDTDQEFELKRSVIYATVPNQHDRIEHVLNGVDKIIMFRDLGFGDSLILTAPTMITPGWPIGNTVHRNLSGGKTAVVLRWILDTLPEPRVPGSVDFEVLAVQCGEHYGPDVEIPGVQGSQGSLALYYRYNLPFITANCCDQGPQMALSSYGVFGDTLLAVFVFNPARADYTVQIIGPRGARGFPRNPYVTFATSRGYLHPDAKGYPYQCTRSDSGSVDLVVGMMKRYKFEQMEPVLQLTIF